MERLASGCSAIQGTACNKRVRFLVPSSLFVSLHLASSPLSLSFSHSFSLFPSPISHSFSFFFFFFCSLSFSLSEIHRRRDHRVILVYLAHVGRAHNTALPLGCTHSQAVYTHTHARTYTRTRHVVRLKGAETRNRLRLDSTRRPTGHKTWPRLKRIVFSSYSSLSLSHSFSFGQWRSCVAVLVAFSLFVPFDRGEDLRSTRTPFLPFFFSLSLSLRLSFFFYRVSSSDRFFLAPKPLTPLLHSASPNYRLRLLLSALEKYLGGERGEGRGERGEERERTWPVTIVARWTQRRIDSI